MNSAFHLAFLLFLSTVFQATPSFGALVLLTLRNWSIVLFVVTMTEMLILLLCELYLRQSFVLSTESANLPVVRKARHHFQTIDILDTTFLYSLGAQSYVAVVIPVGSLGSSGRAASILLRPQMYRTSAIGFPL
jgi:hypothetical protein